MSALREKVLQVLSLPGYGTTAEDVLMTCRCVAEAERKLQKAEITTIQHEMDISQQTWRRMIAISENQQLWENRSVLPNSLSSLYRLSLLRDSTLREGVKSKTINSEMTTRQIESIKKNAEIRSRFKTSKHSLFLFCKEELGEKEIMELLGRINMIASEYNACIDTQNLIEIQKENNRKFFDVQRQLIESRIKDELHLVTAPSAILDGIQLGEDERRVLIQLPIDLPFGDFVKTVKALSRNREEMMRHYGRLYCLKLAQEYWNTESRSQRYNCKRRLREIEKVYPLHAAHARMILTTLLKIEDESESDQEAKPELSAELLLDD